MIKQNYGAVIMLYQLALEEDFNCKDSEKCTSEPGTHFWVSL